MRVNLSALLVLFVCGAMAAPVAAASAALEGDWLFQADNRPTFARTRLEIGWTRELAGRIAKIDGAPALKKELADLAALETKLAATKETKDLARDLYLAVRKVKRTITFKNPVIDFKKVLLIDNPYPGGGEWPHEARHRNGFMGRNGGRLLVLNGLDPDSPVTELVKTDTPGSFWRPDLSFDTKKVVFSMKPHDQMAFHLYEVNSDGTGMKQLTRGDYDDLDPIYLPDGHLMFSTSRSNTYIRCMPYTYAFCLARCDADGKNIYLISRNSETDYVPALTNDGRVIYSRWEYTDKALWRVQSLWVTNPDGTNVQTFWGNQSVWPDHVTEPRPIPGSRRIMFTGVGHHQWFNGCIGIIDPDKGLNFPNGLTKVTADLSWPEVGNGPVDPKETDKYHTAGRYSAYKTPYPIGLEDFLVSAKSGRGMFSLYLMDLFGNRELIYKGKHNAYHASPFKVRKPPASPPDLVAWPGTGKDYTPVKNGVLFSNNVFEGAPDIPRDKVKFLRVIEMDHKTYSTWHKTVQHDGPAVGVFQAESVKRVLGTVPVEADGSVAFEVPPGRAIYLQLIDKDYKCIQTMRSFTGVMPGETRGCLGCHELKRSASQPGRGGPQRSIATRKGPAKLTAPPWGNTESVGYERFVQPVLNKYCAECHMGKGKAVKKLDMTFRPSSHRWRARVGHRPKDPSPFNEPYYTLVGGACGWGRGKKKDADGVPMSLAGCFIVEGYDQRDPNSLKTLKPMTIYSHKSKLIANASSGKHNKVKVDAYALRRLIAWVDCNGPYLGREEIEAMYDPQFGGADQCQIRPRTATAPKINRLNVRQDGDSMAVAGPLKLAPPDVVRRVAPSRGGGSNAKPTTVTYSSIVKVTYGVGTKVRDVTATVKKLTAKGKTVTLSNYNGHFGDPANGTVKELVVTIIVDGKTKTVKVPENTPLTLTLKK